MSYSRYPSYEYKQFSEWDKCERCNKNKAKDVCQNCGDIICISNPNCGLVFPHKNSTLYTICSSCEINISKKFKDITHIAVKEDLMLLKKKISNRIEKNIIRKSIII